MPDLASPQDIEAHNRLIDHFKRVYSIVAGLALTDACRRVLPITDLRDYRFWMFCTLFVTLVPIFHGGDRSLDQKYLGRPPKRLRSRLAFVWDDYMLLITALLFVCIADSIPTSTDMTHPERFYGWMAIMFGFDVAVLLIDLLKNLKRRERLKPYVGWMVANSVLCGICIWASGMQLDAADPRLASVWQIGTLPMLTLSLLVFGCTFVRTIIDYLVGGAFMFPGTVER